MFVLTISVVINVNIKDTLLLDCQTLLNSDNQA